MEMGRSVLIQPIPPSNSGAFGFSSARDCGKREPNNRPMARTTRDQRRNEDDGANAKRAGCMVEDLLGNQQDRTAPGWESSYRLDVPALTHIREPNYLQRLDVPKREKVSGPTWRHYGRARFSAISFSNAFCGSANLSSPSRISVSSSFVMSTFVSMSEPANASTYFHAGSDFFFVPVLAKTISCLSDSFLSAQNCWLRCHRCLAF